MAVEIRTEMDLDVAEEEAMDPTLDLTEMKVGCPGKVEMVREKTRMLLLKLGYRSTKKQYIGKKVINYERESRNEKKKLVGASIVDFLFQLSDDDIQ
ncbi:hypothetical protein LXL04_009362 [Taraxacum kok-saghyz]